ncbi:hypothetical protein HPP92_005160 [Vanilla planifolia]|uniref:Uncharacterized protein n=1 Tax=Vanilla planifolia TaxID=51239 RepID=A0A835RL61_VANPL|nr:hypothetical protein HPP92_005160 [Vanilla planifolia]
MDRKDPDYDRSYDRYMQRFDPGFGFSGGPYTMQPLYAPAVNYNTEFPQLASSRRPQISIDHQPRPIPPMRGQWSAASTTSAVSYCPPEGLMAAYNPNQLGAHPTSSIYLSASQFPVTPRPMPFPHGHEHVQYPQLSFCTGGYNCFQTTAVPANSQHFPKGSSNHPYCFLMETIGAAPLVFLLGAAGFLTRLQQLSRLQLLSSLATIFSSCLLLFLQLHHCFLLKPQFRQLLPSVFSMFLLQIPSNFRLKQRNQHTYTLLDPILLN